jgi:hypothetical protein
VSDWRDPAVALVKPFLERQARLSEAKRAEMCEHMLALWDHCAAVGVRIFGSGHGDTRTGIECEACGLFVDDAEDALPKGPV